MVLTMMNTTIRNILCNTANSLLGTNESNQIIVLCKLNGFAREKKDKFLKKRLRHYRYTKVQKRHILLIYSSIVIF